VRQQEPFWPGSIRPGQHILRNIHCIADANIGHVESTQITAADGVADQEVIRAPAQVEVDHADDARGLCRLPDLHSLIRRCRQWLLDQDMLASVDRRKR
jgi:hypothetical protein